MGRQRLQCSASNMHARASLTALQGIRRRRSGRAGSTHAAAQAWASRCNQAATPGSAPATPAHA
eukprot:13547462-Alexandrium_andersonii.AAC.1